jgi:hypothetical protein
MHALGKTFPAWMRLGSSSMVSGRPLRELSASNVGMSRLSYRNSLLTLLYGMTFVAFTLAAALNGI